MLCGCKGFHSLIRYEYSMQLQAAPPDYTTGGLNILFQLSVCAKDMMGFRVVVILSLECLNSIYATIVHATAGFVEKFP